MPSKPWLKFYPHDWLSNLELQSCSSEARGMLIDALCLMHQSPRRGFIWRGESPMDVRQIALLTHRLAPDAAAQLDELVAAGVIRHSSDAGYYSPRMVKDEEKSQAGRKHVRKRSDLKGKHKGQHNAPSGVLVSGSLDSSGGGMQGGGVDPDEWPGNRVYHVADAYRPTGRVGGSEGSQAAIRDALTRIHGRMGGKPDDAIEWLIGRCRAFASSPAGKLGRFTPLLKNWMADGCYDQDDAEWQTGGEPGQETETQRKARVAAMVQEASK